MKTIRSTQIPGVNFGVMQVQVGSFMTGKPKITVFDVAKYILEQSGEMTTMKLQKLVYYAQAWNLVWEEKPLFHEKIKAWANGPVVPELYYSHKGKFSIKTVRQGSVKRLSSTDKKNIDNILKFYGKRPGHYLSELTHKERPWKEARKGTPAGEQSSVEITHAAMAEYYGGL